MNSPILVTEKNSDSKQIAYVKGKDGSIVCLNGSLEPETSSLTWDVLKQVLLPQGYPGTVSKDYLPYQLWDTLQAFCSTITGILATRAVLQGVGVGDEAASSVSAAITWVLKDGVGMTARIAFAWFSGSRLDRECKKWRLFADVMNDMAICTELFLLPYMKTQALLVLSLSTSMKAIVGVAGGATRASITQHQAICNNMADVSAKDGSQETCVNLLASMFGIIVLSCFGESRFLICVLFFFLTGLHLYANYRAVRSLNINKLNNERFNLVLINYFTAGTIMTPIYANQNESIFPFISKNSSKALCYYDIKIKESISWTKKIKGAYSYEIQLMSHVYSKRKFLILSHTPTRTMNIIIEENHINEDIYEAYFHAFLQGIASAYFIAKDLPLFNQESFKMKNSLIHKIQLLVDSHRRQYGSINVDFVSAVDALAEKEFPDFLGNLKATDWSLEDHYLCIGDWSGNWKN